MAARFYEGLFLPKNFTMPINISAYKPYTNKDGNTTAGLIPYESTLEAEIDHIKTGKHKELISQLYAISDKLERRIFKAKYLHCFTVSCTTHTWRQSANIVAHSGCICIDIDADKNPHITDFAVLRDWFFHNNKSVVAAFVSASGNGLAIIFKVLPTMHLTAFNYLVYELAKFNIEVDRQCKDVVRLRFASYDPDAKIKPYEDCDLIVPSDEFINNQKPSPTTVYKFAGSNATAFANATLQANKFAFFEDGNKYYHLVRVAAYCNHIGMPQHICEQLTIQNYSALTTISNEALLMPIKQIYKGYSSQFGTVKLPPPPYTFKELKWLLRYISKPYLKYYIGEFGNDTYIGKSDISFKVPSKLLAFFMHILVPEHTWSTIIGQPYLIDDIKQGIPINAVIDGVKGYPQWCDKTTLLPLDLF